MVDVFENFFNLSFDMLALLTMNGDFKRINETFKQTLGWTLDELVGKRFWDLITPDNQLNSSQIIQNLIKGHPVIFAESRVMCRQGEPCLLRWTAYPDLKTQNVYLIMREVKTNEDEQKIFRLATESSPTIILIVKDGEIQYANHLAQMVFGYQREELIGQSIEFLVPEHLRSKHQNLRNQYGKNPYLRLMGTELELIGQHKNGREFPLDIGLNPVHTSDGLIVVCSIIDMTKRKAAHNVITEKIKQLEGEISVLDKLSSTDELTSINNRRALFKQLELHYRIAQKEFQPLSFILLDVDNFKNFNDTLGHIAGDEVLKTIAVLMKKSVRKTEIVARYGGEEFGMLLPDTNTNEAKLLAERLRKMIEGYEWAQRKITVSIGTATVLPKSNQPITEVEINQFFIMADKALYFSKKSGKNRVTHFNDLDLEPQENLSNWKIKHETPPDR
jgi:diguanylate cyclase (GGDEF)-like protein/PAS domain S-box-containing protein